MDELYSEYEQVLNDRLDNTDQLLTNDAREEKIKIKKYASVKKYASGGIADYTGLAWIDGTLQKPETVLDANDSKNFIELKDVLSDLSNDKNGIKSIIRPSDGAILTPVALDDDILNIQASSNILEMANNSVDFIRDKLIGSASAPVAKNNNQSFVQHFDKIIFSMPNVTNYSEMLAEMKHDKKFEKLITAMTIDRLAGKSHLTITKYL